MKSSKALFPLFLATLPLHAGDEAKELLQSTTVIQIHETISPLEFGIIPSKNFFRNQVATLTTGSILGRAASQSKIDADKIKKSLSIKIIEGTDMVRITSASDTASEPKLILNSLTEAYVAARSERENKKTQALLEALEMELQDQGDLVQDYRKALTVLIQQYGIPYFEGRPPNPVDQTEEAIYRRAQEKLDQLEQDQNHLQIHKRKLLSTPNEDLIRIAAGLELPENQVTVYYMAFRAAEEQVSALISSGLGSNHPEVKATKLRAKTALENARKEVAPLNEVLEARLDLFDKQTERMKQMLREKQDETVARSMQKHQYNTAKENYEQARSDYREMQRKFKETKTRLALPRHPITIHERAK